MDQKSTKLFKNNVADQKKKKKQKAENKPHLCIL